MTPEAPWDRFGPYTPEEFHARWLRFELIADLDVPQDLTQPVFDEAVRVEPLFNRSAEWRAWWTATSRAPALDLGVCVAWPDRAWFPELVSRGRRQHLVRVHLDAGLVERTATVQRPALLLPAVDEAFRRLVAALRLAPPPTDPPEGALPGA